MNSCKRIACSDLKRGLNTVISEVRLRTNCRRWSATAPPLSRCQTTAAKQAPGADTGEKPRLRAIDLARKVQQERTKPQASEPPVSGQQKRVTELKRFSLQLQNVHPNVLAKHLHRTVLYQDKDVVVISKPYGVPVRGNEKGVDKISSIDLIIHVVVESSCYNFKIIELLCVSDSW